MQLLDDDMDELFRNAASQYPLKTDGADWEALSGRLQSAAPQAPAVGDLRGNKWVWLGILILLTALFFIIYTPPLKTGKLPRTGSGSVIENSLAISHAQVTIKDTAKTINTTVPDNEKIIAKHTIAKTSIGYLPDTHIVEEPMDGPLVPQEPTVSIADTAATSTSDIAAAPQDSTPPKTADTTVPTVAKKIKTPGKVQKGLYFGFIASPDFSTVKMQRVSKVGYSAGIVLGYRISRSFAVETGLLYDHKNYYSEGSCFNKSKIPYTQNWKIVNVDGYCNMFEIPVNVRYFIRNGSNTSWYANAGLSSYLMKKEDYAFKYYDNYGNLKDNSWDYKNATRNWFSIIHVGVGLEHNLGILGKLRVEPYLKIPASGLGIGQLPITSLGVNVGITKSIR